MKFVVSVIVVLFALMPALPGSAAQTAPEKGDAPAPMMRNRAARDVTPEQFAEMKARILNRLDERKSRLEQERACVDASKNVEELRKCRPEPPMGPMGRGGRFPNGPRPDNGQQQPDALKGKKP